MHCIRDALAATLAFAACTMLGAPSRAQSPIGLVPVPWSPGSTITVGDIDVGAAGISLTFDHDPVVGIVLSAIGHRGTRRDGTVSRWEYAATPPPGQDRALWRAVARPLGSTVPSDIGPEDATGFSLWVDSTTAPRRATMIWSDVVCPDVNATHKFITTLTLDISPLAPDRAEWGCAMVRKANRGGQTPMTLDEVSAPIVYAQQPAANAGLARILLPAGTTVNVPGNNLSMRIWQLFNVTARLDHPARGQQMQFSALYGGDPSIQIPLPGGEVLSPFGKILYLTTEDRAGYFKQFDHSVVTDAVGLAYYRWAPVYFPKWGPAPNLSAFFSPYPAVMSALEARDGAYWYDVTARYRDFVTAEFGLTPSRDAQYSLNRDYLNGSVFVPCASLLQLGRDLEDVFSDYVDRAIDYQSVFIEPATGDPSPVFMEWQQWLTGGPSVGEDPFGPGYNPVPFTGVPGAFQEPSQAARDQIARGHANGINMSVYTNPLLINTGEWTTFDPDWLLRDRLGNPIPVTSGHLVDLGTPAASWMTDVLYDDVLNSAPGLGGLFLDTLGGLGSFPRFPPPGQNAFNFRYNGGTAYVEGGQQLLAEVQARIARDKATAVHPDVPLVLTEAVQEFYAGRYDFAQHGIKPLPRQQQLNRLLDLVSGVAVPAPVETSQPHPPLWNAVYHEFSRADALGLMLSVRSVAAALGGGQDFDPANPTKVGVDWSTWGNYGRMVHGLQFVQGMKPTIFSYIYDISDDSLLQRALDGTVGVLDSTVPQQAQMVAFMQRLHEAVARTAEAGQFLANGYVERPLAMPPLPAAGYSQLVVTNLPNPGTQVAAFADNIAAVTLHFSEDALSTFNYPVATVLHSMWRADPAEDRLGLVFVNWSDFSSAWTGTFDPSLYDGFENGFVIKGLAPAGGGVTEYVVGQGTSPTQFAWSFAPLPGQLPLRHHSQAVAGPMPPRSVQVFVIEPQ